MYHYVRVLLKSFGGECQKPLICQQKEYKPQREEKIVNIAAGANKFYKPYNRWLKWEYMAHKRILEPLIIVQNDRQIVN